MAQAFGLTDSARALIRSMPAMPNGGDISMFVRGIPVFAGYADSALLAQSAATLQNAPRANSFVAAWRGLIALESGDPRGAQTIVRPFLVNPDTLQRFMHGTLLGLDGLATVALGDTTRGMAVVDSALKLIGGANSTGFTFPVQLRHAMLLTTRANTRAEGIRRLKYGFPAVPEMYPILQYYLGRAYESAGQPDSAAVAYGQFLRLWSQADTMYRPILADARTALERVTGERAAGGAPVAPTPR